MRNTKGRDNRLELEVRRLLFAAGLRYRVHYPLPGAPRRSIDLAFPSLQIAVFVDGCFWHSCPLHKSQPKANQDFWRKKLADNVQRDRNTDAQLTSRGWTVLRFWTHTPPALIARETMSAVVSRKSSI
jgi:DNA mismatch endonuclease (patch repair protein)